MNGVQVCWGTATSSPAPLSYCYREKEECEAHRSETTFLEVSQESRGWSRNGVWDGPVPILQEVGVRELDRALVSLQGWAEAAHARPPQAGCPGPHPDVFWRSLGWKTPQSSLGKIPLNTLLSKYPCIFSFWWHEHLCSFPASYLKKISPSLHLPRSAAHAGSSLVHAGCGYVHEQCACRQTSGVIWKLVCFIPASVANRND